MAFKYFELAMVIVSVLGRIAGTVAIVWLIVTRLADGFFTPLLVLLVTYFGLGFQMSYKSDKLLVSISSLLMYMAENQAPYMTNLGRILYIAVIILLSLGMIFAAIKRCREVGISVWWSALLVVPIVFLFIVGYLTFAKARPENKSGNHLIEGQVQVDSVEQENPSTSTEVLPKMQNDEVQSSTSSSIWDKLSGPLMMLVMLAYFAYYLVGLGLFGGFVCWFLDIDDNLLLEGLAIFGGFIFMSLVPLGGYAVLAGATYYAAEILDWGWLLAILFVFPGIGFMLLAGAGSLFSVLANKFRASRH